MFRNYLAQLLFLLTVSLAAQENKNKVTVFEGALYTTKTITGGHTLGYYEGDYFFLRVIKGQTTLFRMNANQKEEQQVIIPPENQHPDGTRYYFATIMLENNLYILTSGTNKQTKTARIYAELIDKKTLSINPSIKEVVSFNNYESLKGLTNKNNPGQQLAALNKSAYAFSGDKKNIVIYHTLTGSDSSKDTLAFSVFDGDFKLVSANKRELPFRSGSFVTSKVLPDSRGNLYVTGTTDSVASGTSSWHILSFDESIKKMYSYKFDFPGKSVAEISLRNSDTTLYVTGLYSLKNESAERGLYAPKNQSSARGVAFMHINNYSHQVVNKSTIAFSFDFITMFTYQKTKDRLQKNELRGDSAEIADLRIKNILIQPDGGFILVAEQDGSGTGLLSQTETGGQIVTTSSYTNGHIILLRVTSAGKSAWAQRIPKKQFSDITTEPEASFVLQETSASIYIYFNDSPANLTLKPGDYKVMPANVQAPIICINHIDKMTGRSNRGSLYTSSKKVITIYPKISSQVTPESAILFCLKDYSSYSLDLVNTRE